LIPEWAVRDKMGCGCNSVANKWDKYGIQWCKRNTNLMVEHLMSQAKHLIPALSSLPKSIQRAGAKIVVEKAIYNATRKESG